MSAVGGKITISVNGIRYRAKGKFKYNLGGYTLKEVIGHDGVEGYSKTPRPPSIEGVITDHADFDITENLYSVTDATVLLELANGKNVTFKEAFYTGAGDIETDEGEIEFKMSAKKAFEIKR
ncbi:MAG TPA: phage tail tube protein [Oligoflexus sp.]|uniref:phage tail tube protein n=1 Tax=Oligoflexus sp. TaxID=1971216 RepID=UPI002D7066BF|nr:phage tail tube protein [Oligoflexus sp.]HYX32773.1 phage tail tube protein [Oligoflexus sp.]